MAPYAPSSKSLVPNFAAVTEVDKVVSVNEVEIRGGVGAAIGQAA